ncbi:MAG: SH3 domain-containing protein, partial [Lachnospiraceae bacterium]|nr:SH3 domain-containing protein [Lachnospiraceae bacterium]
DTKIADDDTKKAPETTEFRTDPPETDDPDAIKDAVDEEFIPAKEDTNGYTGLRACFVHKLVSDPEKVELYLHIRETPSMSGKILYVIYPDDIVTYSGTQGDWYRVSLDGFTGYVHKNYVLTDQDAYDFLAPTVAYAAMAVSDHTYLYMYPEDDMSGVVIADKSDSYRVIGLTNEYYKVAGNFSNYAYLYIKKDQSILYYMFQGPGNTSGLDEIDEAVLSAMDISENLGRAQVLEAEARKEREEEAASIAESIEVSRQAAIAASIEASKAEAIREEERRAASRAAEEAARASREAAEEASRAASRAAEEASRKASEEASRASEAQDAEAAWYAVMHEYDVAHAAARGAYLVANQHEAATYDISTLQKITYTDANGVTTDSCRVTFYCHCTKCCGAWGVNDVNYHPVRNGIQLREDYTVAVDRKVIPIGTKLLAVLYNGDQELSRQLFLAADTGVKGLSIDVYRQTHSYCHVGYTLPDVNGRMPAGMYRTHYYVKLYIIP